jgi:hypothetical protein
MADRRLETRAHQNFDPDLQAAMLAQSEEVLGSSRCRHGLTESETAVGAYVKFVQLVISP